MAKSVTYIGFVQDHSGSMKKNRIHAIDNFNEQKAKLLKEDDDTMDNLVTIIEFDDQIYCYVENTPVNKIKELKEWWTGGMTALYDAIGYCINVVEENMKADDREDKAALIIIQTDGQENQSSDYAGEEGRKRINEKIKSLEDKGNWTFVFLGENISEKLASDIGFSKLNFMSHGSEGDDVNNAYSATTEALGKYIKSRKAGKLQSKAFYSG